MSLFPTCTYVSAQSSHADLALGVQRIHDQLLEVLNGRIDSRNFDQDQFAGGLKLLFPKASNGAPDKSKAAKLVTTFGDDTQRAYFREKVNATGVVKGLEGIVDAEDTTYGRVCVVAKGYETQQLLSFIPENPRTVAAPGATVKTPYGTMIFEGLAGDEFVFNESGIDVNFRVESDGDANAIFVDAGNNRVGIGTASPGALFHVAGIGRFGDATTSGARTVELINSAGRYVLSATPTTDRTVTLVDATHTVAGANYANSWSGTQDMNGATFLIKREVEPTPSVGELALDDTSKRLYIGVTT